MTEQCAYNFLLLNSLQYTDAVGLDARDCQERLKPSQARIGNVVEGHDMRNAEYGYLLLSRGKRAALAAMSF